MRRVARIVGLATLLLGSCEGLGRQLVDSTPGGAMEGSLVCETYRTCPPSRPPIVVSPSSFEVPARCMEGPLLTLSAEQLRARGVCQCEHVRLLLVPEDEAQVALGGLTLTDCALEVSAGEPTAVHLDRLRAQRVTIELSGSIALTITDSPQLNDVAVGQAAGEAARGSTLTLEQSLARGLHVAAEVEVDLVRSALLESRLASRMVSAESSSFTATVIETSWFAGVDVNLENVGLDTENGSLSASRADRLSLQGCQAFLIAGSKLAQSQIFACTQLLRLYASSVGSSLVNGPLESDGSSFNDCVLGVGEATRLTAWETEIDQSGFCRGVESLRLGSGTVRCSTCAGPLDEPDADVCQHEQDGFTTDTNRCASLDELAICEDPFPVRQRR